MASLDTTRSATGATLFGANMSSTISGIIARIVAWNDARVTRNALGQLSDHELDDIGLSRGDIAGIR